MKLVAVAKLLPTPEQAAALLATLERVNEAFIEDKRWLDWCDTCILVLPSGRSSVGIYFGAGGIVLLYKTGLDISTFLPSFFP